MRTKVLDLDPSTYQPHLLHSLDRTWSETNCYVDMWIEVLHALGLDPVPAAACALSADFEGDQWTFLKFVPEDLRALYGIETFELNVWKPVIDHIEDQLALGRLLTVEVDAFHLPDTAGTSYREQHTKTTIAPQMLDQQDRRLGYFHNAGYFELAGDDFEGMFGAAERRSSLAPYVEVIKLDRMRGSSDDFVMVVRKLAGAHVALRPTSNPILRFGKRLEDDLPWLAERDLATFHRYAFGTCRQCGVAADLAASFVGWLDDREGGGLGTAVERFQAVAAGAKSLEFALARVVRGRAVDLSGILGQMEQDWDVAMFEVVGRYDG